MVEIIFISSSRTKFAHIEYLLKESKYFISQQRNYGIGYEEPRIYDREQLLNESYVDARKRFEKNVSNAQNKFFMLEDTSVAIDALSSEESEVPGLDIKYWMKEHDFDTVDTLLKSHGNNRKCTVRSDILLHLPQKLQKKYNKEYMIFTGMSEGYICKEEKTFDTNPIYPWLDNKTFNKWFVPEAYEENDTPISQLSIDRATKYDFREKAIEQMKVFLDQEELSEFEKQFTIKVQPASLFDSATFILLGSTCAGKSTLAEYLAETYGYFHIEASDFMHQEFYRKHGTRSSVKIGDFAQKILEENPVVIAHQVAEFCKNIKSKPMVISGFRTLQEIEYFKKHHTKSVQTLYVDTERGIRYERCLHRRRSDVALTPEEFRKKDEQQYDMGIRILEQSVQDVIKNNESFEIYYQQFEASYNSLIKHYEVEEIKQLEDMRLEELILLALTLHEGDFFTTTEIAEIINAELFEIDTKSKNNVSRYFNQYFHPYYDIKSMDGVNKYAINSTGKSRVKYVFEWLKKGKNKKRLQVVDSS